MKRGRFRAPPLHVMIAVLLFGFDEHSVVDGVVGFNDCAWSQIAFHLILGGVPADEGDVLGLFCIGNIISFFASCKVEKVGFIGIGQAYKAPPGSLNGLYYFILGFELEGDGGDKQRIGVESVDPHADYVALSAHQAVEVTRAGYVGVQRPQVEVHDNLLDVPGSGL